MRPWELPRPATGIRHLVEAADGRGVDPAACLEGTGLAPDDIDSPLAEVAVWQEVAVARNVVGSVPDPTGLGVELGSRLHLTAYGHVGLAMAASATLRSALAFAGRHAGLLVSLNRLLVTQAAGTTSLAVDAARVPADVSRLLVERDLAGMLTAFADVHGSPEVRRLELAFPADATAALFEERWGVTPVFDAPANRLVCDDTVLDEPLPQADVHTLWLAATQCAEQLDRLRSHITVSGQVVDRLLHSDGRAGADEVAAALLTSTRTLRRRLAQEGTTFRRLVEQAQLVRASELLRQPQLSVERIALRLGYSDTAAFTHAFTRWTGMSPRAWRHRPPGS